MLDALKATEAATPSNRVPHEIAIKLTHAVAAYTPTHMLAVYSSIPPPSPFIPSSTAPNPPRRVTMYPVHQLMLAAHCAHLPMLPLRSLSTTPAPEGYVHLPIVPLGLPSVETWPALQHYLYTKTLSPLFQHMLPIPALPPSSSADTPFIDIISQNGDALGKMDLDLLIEHAAWINALWRNCSALGVVDTVLWNAIELGYGSIINGIEKAKKRMGMTDEDCDATWTRSP
jgi:hypothetical protein